MDGGAWQATVHGVTKSWTRLSDFTHSVAVLVVKNPPANVRDVKGFDSRVAKIPWRRK